MFHSRVVILLVSAVALVLTESQAHAESTKLRIAVAPIHDYTLANGLRVVAQRAGRQPLVSVILAYNIGARDDPEGYSQLAHVVEHMAYRGSRHLRPYEIMDRLDQASATDHNGETHRDKTVYYAVLPSAQLALPLWLESERMAFTLERFTQAALEQELATVRMELLQGSENSSLFGYQVQSALLGEHHPYRTPIRREAELDSIDLDSVKWFFQKGYRPDNATLIVTGRFEEKTLKELVHRYFAPIPNPPSKVERRSAPLRQFKGKERLRMREEGTADRLLNMVFPGCKVTHSDAVALNAAGSFLAAMLSSRFEDEKLAYDVSFDVLNQDLLNIGKVSMTLATRANVGTVVQEIEEAIHYMSTQPLDREAVDNLSDSLLTTFLQEVEEPLALGRLHLEYLRAKNKPFRLAEHVAKISSLNGPTLARVTRQYLNPTRRLLGTREEYRESAPYGGIVSYEESE